MALQGYIEIAQELGTRGETLRQTQILERSASAADHLATLVKGTLSVSRIEADAAQANLTTFTLAPTVLAAIELLDPREAGDRERELHLDVPADLTVLADQDHVRQVLLNLLSNASKYSPPGSTIDITARTLPPALSNRRNGKAATRQMVEVRVRDHGLGSLRSKSHFSSSGLSGSNVTWPRPLAAPGWVSPFANLTSRLWAAPSGLRARESPATALPSSLRCPWRLQPHHRRKRQTHCSSLSSPFHRRQPAW